MHPQAVIDLVTSAAGAIWTHNHPDLDLRPDAHLEDVAADDADARALSGGRASARPRVLGPVAQFESRRVVPGVSLPLHCSAAQLQDAPQHAPQQILAPAAAVKAYDRHRIRASGSGPGGAPRPHGRSAAAAAVGGVGLAAVEPLTQRPRPRSAPGPGPGPALEGRIFAQPRPRDPLPHRPLAPDAHFMNDLNLGLEIDPGNDDDDDALFGRSPVRTTLWPSDSPDPSPLLQRLRDLTGAQGPGPGIGPGKGKVPSGSGPRQRSLAQAFPSVKGPPGAHTDESRKSGGRGPAAASDRAAPCASTANPQPMSTPATAAAAAVPPAAAEHGLTPPNPFPNPTDDEPTTQADEDPDSDSGSLSGRSAGSIARRLALQPPPPLQAPPSPQPPQIPDTLDYPAVPSAPPAAPIQPETEAPINDPPAGPRPLDAILSTWRQNLQHGGPGPVPLSAGLGVAVPDLTEVGAHWGVRLVPATITRGQMEAAAPLPRQLDKRFVLVRRAIHVQGSAAFRGLFRFSFMLSLAPLNLFLFESKRRSHLSLSHSVRQPFNPFPGQARAPSGLLLAVDQHAADERVRLEELTEAVLGQRWGGGGAVKVAGGRRGALPPLASLGLEQPSTLPLTLAEAAVIERVRADLTAWGWGFEVLLRPDVADESESDASAALPRLWLFACPVVCGAPLAPGDLRAFLTDQGAACASRNGVPPPVARVLNSKACRSAIMFGDRLTAAEGAALLTALGRTRLMFACAHGRPTAAPLMDLAKWGAGRRAAGASRQSEQLAAVLRREGGGGAEGKEEGEGRVDTGGLVERLRGYIGQGGGPSAMARRGGF